MSHFKSLIIGDIHNKVDIVQSIIDEHPEVDEVVFTGDFFDSFYDTPEDAKKTASWIKMHIDNPKFHFIYGNHDMPYAYPYSGYLYCPGYDLAKRFEVDKILTETDWQKFTLYYKTQGFYISHAGITEYHFSHPIHGITDKNIEDVCRTALENAKNDIWDATLLAGSIRGGMIKVGGITWAHFGIEGKPVKGLKQIVGHTPQSEPRSLYIPNKKHSEGEIHCIDCDLRYYGIIEDGEYITYKHNTLTPPKWRRYNALPKP